MKSFVVRQQSRQSEEQATNNLWNWDVWIEPEEGGSLADVDHVVYSLHPAFPSPNRIVREAENGFRLEVRSGTPGGDTWGTFPVAVRLVLRDATFKRFQITLDLRGADGRPALPLLELPPERTLEDHLTLVKRLKSKGAFGYARSVLALARRQTDYGREPVTENLIQQEALCTYKDPLLALDTRLTDALRILEQCRGGLDSTRDPETLGLAGAIYKRMWEVDGQRRNLERAFRYYERGYNAMTSDAGKSRPDYDMGAYTGVNAAFVADLLRGEELGGDGDPGDGVHSDAVRRIRGELVARLEAKAADWWTYASLAEAHLGLAPEGADHYAAAAAALGHAMALPGVDDWQRASTATQLSALVELQQRLYGTGAVRGWDVVARLVPDNPEALRPLVRGRLGLALSGGGFRASLFHVGVLARLAELDLLRQVEVLSCVSGGSIIGAHYYLELRHLLQTKVEGEISREDYVNIVRDLEEKFLAGVQENIRVRLAGSLTANWGMLLQPRSYSRTRRIGDLYEKHIFARVKDGEGGTLRWLNDLFITPLVEDKSVRRLDGNFSPKLHNWRRGAKVPILVLNATSLNTGRNWQFTASSMGESVSYGAAIDATERLETVYYNEAPEEHREVRLGHAVAASSCVPGLFDPLAIANLYEDRVVRLVDGGVHDNQGTRALLDQDCNVLLVSDASGQMSSQLDPSNGVLGVVLRTNSILQARVRIAQHQEIDARRRSQLVREEMLVHLKLDLESPTVAAGHTGSRTPAPRNGTVEETSYGIRRDVQAALAAIRTDLDSFTDLEAYALMTSGYRTAERVLAQGSSFKALAETRQQWRFLAVEPAMQGKLATAVDPKTLLEHLRVGSQVAFKVWSLHPALRKLRVGVAVVVVVAVIATVGCHRRLTIGYTIDLWKVLAFAAVALIGVASKRFGRDANLVKDSLDIRGTLTRMGVGLCMGTVGFLFAWLHLAVFDRWFKTLGHVKAEPTRADALPPLSACPDPP